MKVWITKYALTEGLFTAEVELSPTSADMVVERAAWPRYFHGEGRDWHRTKDAALERCEAMRKRKLASIDKQRQRIAALNFAAMCD